MRRKVNSLSDERFRAYARAGAEAGLRELRAQIATIEQAFPDLATGASATRKPKIAAVTRSRRSPRGMSAEARKAVSVRMKKYWAERRKAKTK